MYFQLNDIFKFKDLSGCNMISQGTSVFYKSPGDSEVQRDEMKPTLPVYLLVASPETNPIILTFPSVL